MSIGASSSSSRSQQGSEATSTSTQTSQSQTGQTIAFQDLFGQLYGNASAAAGRATLSAPQITQASQQLFTGGTNFLQSLGNDAGTNYLTDRISGNDDVLNANLDVLREQTGRLYSEELAPATVARNVSGGTLGGGRQGVAEALDRERAGQVFTEGATALITQNQAQKDEAARSVLSGSLQAASTGLGALPSLLNILTSGNNAELGVYGALSSILGGPTTLTSSSSSSAGQSLSEAFSSGYSRSSSGGFSIGF